MPATIFANVDTIVAIGGSAAQEGQRCVFLAAGDDTCLNAAAMKTYPTGGVVTGGQVTVSLNGPLSYKLCVSSHPTANLNSHFTYVSSVQLSVVLDLSIYSYRDLDRNIRLTFGFKTR